MNILIENAESREYLTNDGEWTKNANEGRNFGATQAAYEAATREPIGKFNIVCYILQKPQFIIIKMDHGTGTGSNARPVQESPPAKRQPGPNGSPLARRFAK